MGRSRLLGEIVPVARLSPALAERLFGLYVEHYDGAEPNRFHADLAEKEWVLLFRDAGSGSPVGFSTQMLLEARVEGRPVRALFSGDTIIRRDYWGSQELVRAWLHLAGEQKARCGAAPFYWFLISKGYRTYLYLPLFFHAFYPRCDAPTPPFEQRLLETLAGAKYPGEFRAASGLIEHRGPHDRLRPELDASARRLRNPHVAFFLQRNPTYAEGTELACIAEIAPENMRGFARAELLAGMRAARRAA